MKGTEVVLHCFDPKIEQQQYLVKVGLNKIGLTWLFEKGNEDVISKRATRRTYPPFYEPCSAISAGSRNSFCSRVIVLCL